MLRSALVLVGFFGFLSSCGEQHTPNKDQTGEMTLQNQKKHLFVVQKEKSKNRNYNFTRIGIKEEALGKDFLFHGSMMAQVPLTQFSGIKSRVVYFERHHGKLYMKENTFGHSISSSIEQDILLANFDIDAEENGNIYFDFAKGFQKIFFDSEWRAQDLEGGDYKESWDSAPLSVSYIDRADMFDDTISIKQVGQLSLKSLIHLNSPVTMKYYLTPYKENPNFVPSLVKDSDFDTYGYFEVAPQLIPGMGEVVLASKFDHKKKIVYGVSHNTPEEFRQAIKDGVLYWNKAFGKDVVEVVDLPEGITAPHFQHNIIQWVDWNDAGFAYADAQMDPHTGETHHAQIFMTSAFAFSSREEVQFLLKKLRADKKNNHKIFALRDAQEHLCDFDPRENLEDVLSNLLNQVLNLDNDKILKISNDYIREVVAHEVGHTLGLRHNFAGTRYSNISPLDKESVFHDYLLQDQLTDKVTTSSVMDYQRFMDAILTGAQINARSEAFDYDKMAIRHLYDGENYPLEQIPLFCTDSHVGEYIDCNRFDSGAFVAEYWLSLQKEAKDYFPHRLVDLFVHQKKLGFSLDQINIKADRYAQRFLAPRLTAMESLQKGKKILNIRRHPDLIGASEDVYFKEERAYLADQFQHFDLFKNLFTDVETDFDFAGMQQNFLNLLSQEFIFSLDEKMFIKEKVEDLFYDLPFEMNRSELTSLIKIENLYHKDDLGIDFFNWIKNRSSKILSAVKEEEKITSKVVDKNVLNDVTFDVPIFQYHYSLRKLAAHAYGLKWIDPSFAEYDTYRAQAAYAKILDKAVQKEFSLISSKDYESQKMRRWIWENKKVMTGFTSAFIDSEPKDDTKHGH